MGYLDRLVRLVTKVQLKGIAIWQAYADDKSIDAATASAVLATQIQQSNYAASNLASLAFSAKQSVALQTFTPVPPLVRPVVNELPRLHKAAETVLQVASESDDPPAIVARLVRSESLQAAADAFSIEMEQSWYVEGYRRQVHAGACERCIRWARGGKTFKPDTHFPTHPGCTCTPEPVFVDDPDYLNKPHYTV